MEKADEIQHDFEFNQDMSNTNRIVIKLKKSDQGEGARKENSFEDNLLETKNMTQVKFLDSLLNKIPKTGYCCCPNTNYSIALYNSENLIDTYYADTLQYKNKVRIFEVSYQFSFLVDKEIWRKFLSDLK